jgi:Protein of unknown function (DUF2867)
MISSFRFWCFFAGAVSLATAVLHVFGGGPEFHQPALDSALPAIWKAAFSTIWHAITAMLAFDGVFLIFAGLALRKNRLLLWLILLLNVAFAALFVGYGLARLGTVWALPQWTFFAVISFGVALALWLRNPLDGVEEKETRRDLYAVLPAATFADTYTVHGTEFAAAMDAARGAFGVAPRWISTLMQIRHALVAPFGLVHAPSPTHAAIGIFPILLETPEKVVLGLDDKHLDFRVVVELLNGGRSVSLTTLVEPHHRFGQAYLTAIMPFHRLIAATILNQAARRKG